MFGIESLLSNPAIVKAAAKSAGIQAVRLDYDPAAKVLWGCVLVNGKVTQRQIPTGRQIPLDEILAMLLPGPQPDARPAKIHIEIETTLTDPPPPA